MTTRALNNICKPKKFFYVATKHPTPLPFEPTCVVQALNDPNWRLALFEEFNFLLKNDTWELVPLPPNKNTISCKWVFHIKRNLDRTIARYKIRLVAKGY